MNDKIFDTKNIILLKISESDLNSFIVDLDIKDDGSTYYPLEELARTIISVIPEYVFAQYKGSEITLTNVVENLRQASLSIYKIG